MLRCRRRTSSYPLASVVALTMVVACAPHVALQPPPAAIEHASTDSRTGGLLWRVARGEAVSHVFGTVHVGRELRDALGPAGMTALAAADTVVVEIDLDTTETVAALADVIRRRGRLPDGRSLDGILTPPTWQWVADALAGQTPEAVLRRTQPWLAVHLVIGQRAAAALAPAGADGVATPLVQMDRVILRRARARGKRLVALETVAEQIEALATMPEAAAVEFLEAVARDPTILDDQLRALVDSAGGSDAATGIERMVADYVADAPAMADAIFFERNARWVPRLVPLLADGDAFVAVGAGHLVGDRGLVALLRAEGFDVAPVTR